MAITPIEQVITIPPPPPTGLYDADFQVKVNNLLAWYDTHATEETEFIAKLETMITEVNANSVATSDVYDATVVIYDNAVTVYNNTLGTYDDTIVVKADTQTIYDNTLAFANASYGNTFFTAGWDGATDFQNKTTHHNGGWWASTTVGANVASEPTFANADWAYIGIYNSEITMAIATHTAVSGQYIKVDATTIGADCTITLPATPLNRDRVTILNLDDVRTNTLLIARGDVLHKIIGKLEDTTMNCLCEKTLVFESTTQNWIQG